MVTLYDLKILIIPQLKMHIPKEDYYLIDSMFEEVYMIKEDGQMLICLKPIPAGDGAENISLMFYALNGAYRDIGEWEYIKKIGELI